MCQLLPSREVDSWFYYIGVQNTCTMYWCHIQRVLYYSYRKWPIWYLHKDSDVPCLHWELDLKICNAQTSVLLLMTEVNTDIYMNSEFKFKCSYEHEQKRFQPTDYKLFVRISYDIRDRNILYKREPICNTPMQSTKECQHVSLYIWNSTCCLIRWVPPFWFISVGINQQF